MNTIEGVSKSNFRRTWLEGRFEMLGPMAIWTPSWTRRKRTDDICYISGVETLKYEQLLNGGSFKQLPACACMVRLQKFKSIFV